MCVLGGGGVGEEGELFREIIILFNNESFLQLNKYVYGRLLICLNCFQIFCVIVLFQNFHVKKHIDSYLSILYRNAQLIFLFN